MNIKGLDYNTQREKLILPEYGREVQNMVDHCLSLEDKEERQECAETIISIMKRMFTQSGDETEYEKKLWDHLAIMSNFKLDIDWPYDVSEARKISTKPEPLKYPMNKIPVRHYGNQMFELFNKLKTMEPGDERDELVRITANQMKRDLIQWGHGSCDDEKVASDLARYTDGKIQLNLNSFTFEKINERELIGSNKKKKR
jgi:hypothetical protein